MLKGAAANMQQPINLFFNSISTSEDGATESSALYK
jgi:hypothetical protein